ncbi:MDR family MFS transporter [Rhodopirellula sp. SWK7]|uniref:MDR family MFS transporter n=1 Tax=Rhodopirellula sp. SWK7 TaxID=595460 RepID=UPI0002BF086A|nr:MFS transporter [Rhodopirellula sp. SWK7]EMI43957.1 major facilitator family transporter [Rhodopirellula sp. SWK7]
MKSFIRRYRRSFEGLPRSAWILALVMLVNRSGAMVLAFLSIYLSQELGWGERFAGYAIATYGLGACVGSFTGGRLAGRFGAYRVQQTSLVSTAIGFILLSQMDSKGSVLVTLFMVSIAAESLRPANVTAIAESVPTQLHRRAFALNRLALNLGFTLGPAMGGFLAQYSYTWLFFSDALFSLLAFGLLTAMHHAEHRRNSVGTSSPLAERAINESGELASTRQFLCFIAASFAMFLVFFQLMSTHPIFLRNEYGMVEWQIGLLFSINTLIIVATEMVLVESLQRFSDLRIIAVGAFLSCEGFAVLSFGSSYHFAVVAVLIWTVGEMIAMPTMLAYVSRSSPVELRAKRIGTYSTTVSFGFVIAPLLGAWCYGIHPRLIWWIAGVMGPIVLIAFWRLDAWSTRVVYPFVRRPHWHDMSIEDARQRSIRDSGIERVEPFT